MKKVFSRYSWHSSIRERKAPDSLFMNHANEPEFRGTTLTNPVPLPATDQHATDSPGNGQWSASWAAVGLGLILVMAGVIRMHHFTTVTSWFDESLGWRMTQFSFGEIIERSERNVHPPLHFLCLAAWSRIAGDSLLSLRGYALFWGMATIVGGFFLAKDIFRTSDSTKPSRFAGLLTAALIALSSIQIHWSQQIKMYTLGTALTLWSSWFLLRWFQSRGVWRLVCYVLLAAALSLQHHYGTFTVFAQLTFALIWSARRSLSPAGRGEFLTIFATGWATVTLWSLWLPAFLNQRALVKQGYWIGQFDWQHILTVWRDLFLTDTSIKTSEDVTLIIAQAVLATVLFLLVQRRLGSRFLGWLVLSPYVVAVAWSLADGNVFVSRFLINSHICLLVGIAVLTATVPNPWLRGTVAGGLIALSLWPAYEQRLHRTRQSEVAGMPKAVEMLRGSKADDEPVLVCNPMLYLNLCVYNDGLKNTFAYNPGHGFPHFQGAPVMREDEYFGPAALEDAEIEWVWTLDAENWLGGSWKTRLPAEWTLQHERSVPEWYGTLVIRSYQRERP